MGVRRRLLPWALARPRVLVVDPPASRGLRWAVEDELDRRGWPFALSPADTDLLLVLGPLGPELSAAVELVWSQVPQPRHRHENHADAGIAAQLDAARASLLDTGDDVPAEHDMAGHDMAGHDMPEHDMPGHDMPEGDTAGHDMPDGHEMHHGGDVAGLPMAGTAPDRDGLELDSLQVSLGPVLPAWPTGLRLDASMQGDVLTDVELSWVEGGPSADEEHAPRPRPRPRALALDRLARFLVVAGWPQAARQARHARSGLTVAGPVDGQAEQAAVRVARRVRRSRPLAWSVAGIPSLGTRGTPPDDLEADTLRRVYGWCAVAAGEQQDDLPKSLTLEQVSTALDGSELGAARLVVAGLDPAPTRDGARG